MEHSTHLVFLINTGKDLRVSNQGTAGGKCYNLSSKKNFSTNMILNLKSFGDNDLKSHAQHGGCFFNFYI